MPSVLHVLPYANLNGTERHALLLTRHARSQGWDAAIALPPGPMRDLLAAEGIPIVEIPPVRLSTFTDVIRRLRHAMTTRDLAHVHAAMELALALGWKRPFPLVFTAHCYHTALDYAKAGLFLNPSCSATVSVSAAERTRLLRGGLDPARHHTILNGIDLAPFHTAPPSPLLTELGLPGEALLVGTIGRLSRMKRVDVLIRAVALCRQPIHLVVAGDGEQRRPLENLAGRLGVSARVHWLGRRSDVATVLGGLDVFATASEREGLSLAALEAMATGLPLTLPELPEFADLIDPRWTLAHPPGRAEAWAASWEALHDEPERRRRMGEAARTASMAFAAKRMGEETLGLYRELLTTEADLARSAASPPAGRGS